MYDERLDDVNAFNINLGVEDYILKNIHDVHLVLLTGDAGDGKSRVLTNLKNHLDSTWNYVNDFSEFDEQKQKDCIENIYNATANKNGKYIIAGNSGIFINAVVQFKYELLIKLKNRENCLVLNFKNRNVAESKNMFLKIITKFLDYNNYEKCRDCQLREKCPFLYNLEKMNTPEIIECIRILFDALFLIGVHISFRDLLSLLSYFVTRGMDCSQLLYNKGEETKLYFFNNIFEYKGSNTILSKLSEIDIKRKDINNFDYRVYHSNFLDNDIEFNISNYGEMEKLKILKRYYYFTNPNMLKEPDESIYSLLPIENLTEYKDLIAKIKNVNYIDSMDNDDEILRKFELGLNKISNPNHSNAQLVLFDSPPITSKDVRIEYSSGQQLRLIFCIPRFYFTNGELGKEEQELDDLNAFYCFVYGSDTFEKCPVIKIDYHLFNQIMLAQNNIFTDGNAKLSDNVHIQSFTKAIFDKIDTDYGVIITWTGSKIRNIEDFNMSFIKPTNLGIKKDKKNKVLISSASR
jgi:hypothetical protein